MLLPLADLSPEFRTAYDKWRKEWQEDDDPPVYLALSEYARCTISALENARHDLCRQVFQVVERWLLDGDPYVREAAAIGFLEDLQNTSIYEGSLVSPDALCAFMHPETLHWWKMVARFWSHGELLVDEPSRQGGSER